MMAKSYGSAAESQLPTIEAVVSQYISGSRQYPVF